MEQGFEILIKQSASLPSPPAIAMQVIELAHQPEVSAKDLKSVIEKDPALASKVLRVVNSAMYGQHREIETLSQAIVIMGFNATVSLALSFSLVSSLKKQTGHLDYGYFWRRAFLSAAAARVIADTCGEQAHEEVFLAALLQDIGMLAIDKIFPEIYAEIGDRQYNQVELLEYEQANLHVDHAETGGWLLRRWHLPNRTALSVEASHSPLLVRNTEEYGRFVRCVALSGPIADIFVNHEQHRPYDEIHNLASSYLQLNHEQLDQILDRLSQLIPEVELLFNTRLTEGVSPLKILEQAREALVERNIAVLQELSKEKSTKHVLDQKARELELSKNRDALTGLHNRAFVEEYLCQAFEDAKESGVPISLAFVELDNFDALVAKHGRETGEQVLCKTAEILKETVRGGDIVSRYGGEEFVVLLPGAAADSAQKLCERIARNFHLQDFNTEDSGELAITVSIGVASQQTDMNFDSVNEMLKAADSAKFTARLQGKNQVLPFVVHKTDSSGNGNT